MKRMSYTIQTKLEIINQYEKGVDGKGLPAIAKAHGISRETLRGWVSKKKQLEAALADDEIQSKKTRRLKGGGRKEKFVQMEEQLHAWILDKNAKGLGVKDHYIQMKALNIVARMQNNGGEEDKFVASNGWLARFKSRKQLVSKRQISCLSEDDIACEAPYYYQPDLTLNSLFACLARKSGPDKNWKEYKNILIEFMKTLDELRDITSDDYFNDLQNDKEMGSVLEIYAASVKENWNIVVVNRCNRTSDLYKVPNPVDTITLVKCGDYFVVKMIDK